jgi:hypothetical protein
MSLHDNDVYHGSGPNRSTEKRVGFAIRYVTPDACAVTGRPRVLVARGDATSDNFEICQPPADAPAQEALEGVRESAREHLDAMLATLKKLRPRTRKEDRDGDR